MTPEDRDAYLKIYLAEYESLSTRLTYWLTLQYVPYSIAAAALGYFVQAWRPSASPSTSLGASPALAWSSLLILQLLMWAVLQSTHEVFTYVVYFKECLKPKIRRLLPRAGGSFLDFEPFLNELRRRWFLRFEQTCGLFLVVAGGMAVSLWLAISSTPPPRLCRWSTIGWAISNLYVLFILCGKSWDILRLQKRAKAADPPEVWADDSNA